MCILKKAVSLLLLATSYGCTSPPLGTHLTNALIDRRPNPYVPFYQVLPASSAFFCNLEHSTTTLLNAERIDSSEVDALSACLAAQNKLSSLSVLHQELPKQLPDATWLYTSLLLHSDTALQDQFISVPLQQLARAYTAHIQGNNTQSLIYLDDFIQSLNTQPDLQNNALHLFWHQLQTTPNNLEHLTPTQETPSLLGWRSLIATAKEALQQKNAQALLTWKLENPNHIAGHLIISYPNFSNTQESLTVAFPRDSSTNYTNTITHGIIDQYWSQKAQVPLSFSTYDIDNPSLLLKQIENSSVIGPMSYAGVKQLNRTSPQNSMLALNYLPEITNHPNLRQWSLSPLLEISQVKQHMQNQGLTRTLILYENKTLYINLSEAFSKTYQPTTTESFSFSIDTSPQAQPLTRQLKDVLGIERSEQRYKQLQAILPTKLIFSPSPRKDIDSVFIAASPQTFKRLVPIIRFLHLENIPIFTLSNVNFSTHHSDPIDSSLDKAYFFDSDNKVNIENQTRNKTYTFARDAYFIYSMHDIWSVMPSLLVKGNNGLLYLDQDGVIRRILSLNSFVRGRVQQDKHYHTLHDVYQNLMLTLTHRNSQQTQ